MTDICAPTKQAINLGNMPKKLRFEVFDSMSNTPSAWDLAAPTDNIFLQRTYLTSLEETPPQGMQFCYTVVYDGLQVLGVVYGQLKLFRASDSLQPIEHEKQGCFFDVIGQYLKGALANLVEFETLICGNLLLTGEHGYYFNPTLVSKNEIDEIVIGAAKAKAAFWEKQGRKASVTLIKDFYAQQKLPQNGFTEFSIQPSMVMDLPDTWDSFEDYMLALSSKYRVRTRRAFKKGAALHRKQLTAQEVKSLAPKMYEYYLSVAENAGFNVVDMHQNYLPQLKANLPEQVHICGYFLEEVLVGYTTLIQNGNELEAHFLGYDKKVNHDCQLYHNMLLDMLRFGIEHRHKNIVFARTALEIKSSIGAQANEMYCYFKHRNHVSNKLLKHTLDILEQKEPFTPRHPFKEE